ncbi:hypothetical protein BDZ97DRAFT_1696682 [Flammula alnicola]|nr:hypothetical protein BDZ97DRAFT_1696682 [Flammula alnicola]
MAGGNKRGAEESNDHDNARVTKVARTGKNGGPSPAKGSKAGTKKAQAKLKLSPADFKAKALPLHVILTHTPPSIAKEGEIDGDGKEEKAADTSAGDVGFIGNLTLVPSSFSTGSYGWKGSKRVTVELQAGDSESDGAKEKVQVMLTINATVLGSKPEKEDTGKGKRGKKAQAEEEEEEEEEEGEVEEPEDA